MMNMTMLVFMAVYFLATVHQCLGSYDLPKLLKKYPTWTFELESVDSLIKSTLEGLEGSLKHVDPVLTEKMLRAKMNVSLINGGTHIVRKVGDPNWVQDPKKLPVNFDARDKWKDCAHLMSDVEDEGVCNTDGPTTVSSVMADRYCIFTNGAEKKILAQEMLAGCGEFCTREPLIVFSWKYATEFGIPSGSDKGCLPYTHSPCRHGETNANNASSLVGWRRGERKLKPCSEDFTYDHDCPKKCSNSKYPKPLEQDLVKCNIFYVTGRHEFCVRNEIFNYGPVATSIILYDDFFDKPNGMYKGKEGRKFVSWDKYFKLIGWGEENNVKYWLAVNTWNQWGDKVFKIPRGVNQDYVEYILSTCVYDD